MLAPWISSRCRRIVRAPLAIACLGVILSAGCGRHDARSALSADVLRIAYADDPTTLNPLTAGDATSGLVQSLVYEPLADRKMSDPDQLVPKLAEKWTFDEKTLECTIHLRRGVKWQPIVLPNGTPLSGRELTSRDVKFTFDCLLNPHIPATGRGDYEDPAAQDEAHRYKIQVEVLDDYTLKIRWAKPYFSAEESSLLVAIIPRHVFSVDEQGDLISLDFASKEFAEGFIHHWASTRMCGTGPLAFAEWQRNERLVLKRFRDYWGEPFHFERLVFRCEPNEYTLVQKLLQGEVDWADIGDKELFFECRDQPSVVAERVALKTYDYGGYRYLGYNLRRPFLREKAVRRALTQATPIDEIIRVVYDGLATQVTGPFLLRSKAYNHDLKPLAFDPARAAAELEKAGWRDSNNDGTRDKVVDGTPVEARVNLLIEANGAQARTTAEIIQSTWRQIGVRLDITPVQESLMTQRTRAKDFDAVLRGWSLSWRADPYQTWFSGNAEIADTPNIIGYRNEEVDRLVTDLRVTFDRAKQLEIYHRVHELLYEDQPYTFLFSEQQTCGYNTRLRNVRFYAANPCIDYREWSLAPSDAAPSVSSASLRGGRR